MGYKNNLPPALQVVLGSQTIKAFVAAPKEFKVLGIVRMGMEFGLLATTASGHYVRVNGSTVQDLRRDLVEEAIRVARSVGRGESYATTRSHEAAYQHGLESGDQAAQPPALVIRKRRRHVEVPAITVAPAVNQPMQVSAA